MLLVAALVICLTTKEKMPFTNMWYNQEIELILNRQNFCH